MRLPAEDGQPGQGLEAPLVHPEERRDPLLQVAGELHSQRSRRAGRFLPLTPVCASLRSERGHPETSGSD